MIEVGIRELKSRLSYYMQLIQAGETIAIKIRNRIVGFLSDRRPAEKMRGPAYSKKNLQRLIDRWKQDGFIVSGGLCRLPPIKQVKPNTGPSSTDIIRQMRDED